ncbi:hypothetical protein BDP27DRAFT_1228365, partial [Rhodocollybia butyracea]
VVNAILTFWQGILFAKTFKYSFGRRVSAVLVPVVCDADAAHPVSGFPSHSHTFFCTRCLLRKTDINNLDIDSWPKRDIIEHRRRALEWLNASPAELKKITKEYGVRYTPLLRLPYWDAIAYTIIDSMHMGLLGLFETHIHNIWGIKGDAGGRKKVTRDKLVLPNSTLLTETWTHTVIDDQLRQEVKTDMQRTILPTWMNAAPLEWGTPSGGQLTFPDVLCSIHLVVTLIRVWAYDEDTTKLPYLYNFTHPVKGVHILFLRSTSPALIEQYTSHMLEYLKGLLQLFPDIQLAPNHHYSLHMGEFMESMGPNHSRNTFATEQINGYLQDTDTNHIQGIHICFLGILAETLQQVRPRTPC